MRILTFADYHLKVYQGDKIDETTSLPIRTMKTLNLLDEMIEYAFNNKINYIISAGDLYDTVHSNSTLQREFNKRIKYAAKQGVKVYLLAGNHDTHKVENKSYTIEVFDTLEVENVFVTKDFKEYLLEENGERVRIISLPTIHDNQDIEHIMNKKIDFEKSNDPIVIVGHLTIKGATFNHNMIAENEESISRELFMQPNVVAVVLGHLHQYQLLMDKPLIYYCGSLQRKDFNEEIDKKGFVVIDISPNHEVTYDFIELKNAQQFITLDYNLIDVDNCTQYILEDIDQKKKYIKDAIVRINITQNADTLYDKKSIYDKLEELKAYKINRIVPIVINNKRQKIASLNENTDPSNATEIYFKTKYKGNPDKILSISNDIIETLTKAGKI